MRVETWGAEEMRAVQRGCSTVQRSRTRLTDRRQFDYCRFMDLYSLPFAAVTTTTTTLTGGSSEGCAR
ncbi:hypothetical protein D0B32_01125 [Paraburkholderia sp. DHOC27]|nr:hypothetical protein D0B32_01125 [Paraburkholderia sp. DHOC27]